MNDATKVWVKGATIFAAVAVGGLVVYKLYQAYLGRRMLPPAKPVVDGSKSTGPEIVALEMPHVDAGENLSTKTEYIITAKNPAYRYVRIERQYQEGGQTVYDFRSPINGYFTDKLLSLKGQLYAEIRPA